LARAPQAPTDAMLAVSLHLETTMACGDRRLDLLLENP
jgi:hypothetical protein